MRRLVVERQTAAMRRLGDYDRHAAIAAAGNVIGFERFAPFAPRVRGNEITQAVTISCPRILA